MKNKQLMLERPCDSQQLLQNASYRERLRSDTRGYVKKTLLVFQSEV